MYQQPDKLNSFLLQQLTAEFSTTFNNNGLFSFGADACINYEHDAKTKEKGTKS
jgi:hypothetical protein